MGKTPLAPLVQSKNTTTNNKANYDDDPHWNRKWMLLIEQWNATEITIPCWQKWRGAEVFCCRQAPLMASSWWWCQRSWKWPHKDPCSKLAFCLRNNLGRQGEVATAFQCNETDNRKLGGIQRFKTNICKTYYRLMCVRVRSWMHKHKGNKLSWTSIHKLKVLSSFRN